MQKTPIAGKRITVAGLGRFGGGVGVARWLCHHNARVLVTDREPAAKLAPSLDQLAGLPIEFVLGGHREVDFLDTDLVVASPAIPPDNPLLAAARERGVRVTTEICLFIERCQNPVVGVTGTKGKSTTTALLSRMLQSRHTVWTGGNIGVSLLPKLKKIEPEHLVVLELSSFMLHYLGPMRFAPQVAVMTMLASDHVEWHGSLEAYLEAKKNLIRHQTPEQFACIGRHDTRANEMARDTRARVESYEIPEDPAKYFELLIPGRHNQLNAQAAFCAAEQFGVTFDEARQQVDDFTGLPHRLERVCERDGVRFFNDSIATIPEAAKVALESFEPRKVIQIVGGSDKHLPMDEFADALASHAKAVLTIGKIGRWMGSLVRQRTGDVDVHDCETLDTAIETARQVATAGDIVLLSPATASYDQFDNFRQRGERFSELARAEQ